MKYFWYHRPEEGFPPPSVQTPVDPPGPNHLCVWCTQTSLKAAHQKRLVTEWCRVLPLLLDVRFLWFSSRVTQDLFDAACAMKSLEGLWIKWSGIRSLQRLPQLTTLRYFHLGSSTGVTSLEPLREMSHLKWLGLENLKRIRDFGVLENLRRLEGLTLEGSMWTTQRVKTLRPIGALTDLRYLSLVNLRSDDGTLRPLCELAGLEAFHAAEWWDDAERAEIYRRNPGLTPETRFLS